jgi:hypothetical protein
VVGQLQGIAENDLHHLGQARILEIELIAVAALLQARAIDRRLRGRPLGARRRSGRGIRVGQLLAEAIVARIGLGLALGLLIGFRIGLLDGLRTLRGKVGVADLVDQAGVGLLRAASRQHGRSEGDDGHEQTAKAVRRCCQHFPTLASPAET